MGEIASFTLPWWLTSIGFSVCFAMFILVNQQLKARASAMMVWRGLAAATFAFPFIFFVTPPSNPWFYPLSVSMGVLGSYFDNRLFTASSKYGAGAVSRIIPTSIILSFFGWFLFHPTDLLELAEEPIKLLEIILCMVIAVLAVFAMKKNVISKEIMLFLIPSIFLVSAIDIMNKATMGLISQKAIIYHVFIASFVSGMINLAIYKRENARIAKGTKKITHPSMEDGIFTPKTVKAGLSVAFFVTILMLFKAYSMQHTPNPAYVSAIGYTSPLFILAFNKMKGIKDDASVKAGLVLVASIICMVILVS